MRDKESKILAQREVKASSRETEAIPTTDLKVQEDRAGNVLASTSLREEGVESIIATTDGLVRGHLTVRLDSMLQTVQLPAGIANLDTGLTDVDGNNLTHVALVGKRKVKERRGEQQQEKRRTRTRFPASCEDFQNWREALRQTRMAGFCCYVSVRRHYATCSLEPSVSSPVRIEPGKASLL